MSCSTSLAACVCSAGHFSPTGCPCQQCVHRSYIVANQSVCIDCGGMSTQLPPTPPATSPPAFYQVITPLPQASNSPNAFHSLLNFHKSTGHCTCGHVCAEGFEVNGANMAECVGAASTRPSGQFTTAESIQTEIVPPIPRSVVQFPTDCGVIPFFFGYMQLKSLLGVRSP